MWEILLDAAVDTVRLIPFLFLTYLLMEYLEHKTGEKAEQIVKHSGRMGPIVGGVLGIVPQCGFSAAASGLYAGRLISLGTLLAIYLSTSDEMLPIMISEQVPIFFILKILILKVIIGIIAGIAVDFFLRKKKKEDTGEKTENYHQHCCEKGIVLSAVQHTVQILLFIFIISSILNGVIELVGEERISHIMLNQPVIGEFVAGLVGLIPNCASSVVITQLYLEGMISLGSMMAGVLVGAGIGLLVLFRLEKNKKEFLKVVGLLYVIGVGAGMIIELISPLII